MARLDKPGSVQITVRNRKKRPVTDQDRKEPRSKSFMVYETNVTEAVDILKRAFKKSKKEVKPK